MDLNVQQLKQLARERGIRGFSTMKKEQLRQALGITAPSTAQLISPVRNPPTRVPVNQVARNRFLDFDADVEMIRNGDSELADLMTPDNDAVTDFLDSLIDQGRFTYMTSTGTPEAIDNIVKLSDGNYLFVHYG